MNVTEQVAAMAEKSAIKHGLRQGESETGMGEDIHSILNKIQVGLLAKKTKSNEFNLSNKYNYRSCEDILEALKPHLKEHNCTILLNDDLVLVGERYYIKATATIRCFVNLKELRIEATAYAREVEIKKGMDAAQITGSTSSYARKYALNGLFAIDDTKDPDATNNHNDEELDALVNEIKEAEEKGRWDILALLCRQLIWADAWGQLDTHVKGKINKLMDIFGKYRDQLNLLSQQGDDGGIIQLLDELTKEEKNSLRPTLAQNTRDAINRILKKKKEKEEKGE